MCVEAMLFFPLQPAYHPSSRISSSMGEALPVFPTSVSVQSPRTLIQLMPRPRTMAARSVTVLRNFLTSIGLQRLRRKNLRTCRTYIPCQWSLSRYVCPLKKDYPATDRHRFQLITGEVPFPEFTDYDIPIKISKGKRPPKPDRFEAPGTSKAVWGVAKKCWHNKAEKRPEVHEVVQNLEKIFKTGEFTQEGYSYLRGAKLICLQLKKVAGGPR